MDSCLELRDIYLTDPVAREKVTAFLAKASLSLDDSLTSMVGLYTPDDCLKGTGGLADGVIRCVALDEDLRGAGAAATLVTELMRRAWECGCTNVRVFTKPEYIDTFTSLGFTLIGSSDKAVLMESNDSELKEYKRILSSLNCEGVIVANANPCTNGHLWLIEQAAERCSRLAVIPVEHNEHNMFSYRERVEMLSAATKHLPNVVIAPGSRYAVSAVTFPSYFLKESGDVARAQAEVDLDIFRRHIAPSLGARLRFVGTEPADKLTADYNEAMKRLLPEYGVEVVELYRKEINGEPVSASKVRRLLCNVPLKNILALVPPTDLPYLLAELAERALVRELTLTPKPGLVDVNDSGSHTDMDYELMLKGIRALRPYFVKVSYSHTREKAPDAQELRTLGLEGEKMMLSATNGVNTHKGAVFALGLAVGAATRVLLSLTDKSLSEEIVSMAQRLDYTSDTHGAKLRQETGMKGAMDYARTGYSELFDTWLPYLKSQPDTDESRLKLLLMIISGLEDTNACYRAGVERAAKAQQQAASLLENFSLQGLEDLNQEFKKYNISHGGAADMLALTIFVQSINP